MVTTELRYFFKGELNAVCKTAIDHFKMLSQGTRQDNYLPNEASATFGVKWREGNLEVKGLVSKMKYGGVSMENWEKNTIPSEEAVDKTGSWLNVTKHRWLQFFDDQLRPCNEQPQPDMLYCQLEISEIEVNGKTFHSLCLECQGGNSEDRATLLFRCLQMLKDQLPELSSLIHTQKPCSYPDFLMKLTTCT